MKTKTEIALVEILSSLERMPEFSEEIAQEIMRGEYELAISVGGDSADISRLVAIARIALKP